MQCTLRQMKMTWQSKNRSKSVGHIFNQFNAFWVLPCILINILSLFLCITSRKRFRGGQFGHFIYINELKFWMGESFSTEKMVSFHQISKKGQNKRQDLLISCRLVPIPLSPMRINITIDVEINRF